MVLPEDLLAAIKQRAREQGLSVTAYISALVRSDLAEAANQGRDLPSLTAQIEDLRRRVNRLERPPTA